MLERLQSINQSIIYFDTLRRGARKLRIFIRTCINKIYNNYNYVMILFNFKDKSLNIYKNLVIKT